ncbi:lipoprotein [Mycoplasma capricolum]|uniref:lipoprotein n=1 Tax=Mycoplasma capricolum TaxID=2095 RepID=UPI003DA2C86C
MKKLLGVLMFGSITVFPALTVISCSTTKTHTITTSFNSDVKVDKYIWKDNKFTTEGQSTNIQDITKSLNGSTNAYTSTVSDVLNLLTRNIQEVRNLKESYDLFRGNVENTSVLGYYTGADSKQKKITQQQFYKNLDDSNTHISSLKGLLQFREFVNNNKNSSIVSSWTKSLKEDAEQVKKWDENFVKNLNSIVNSSTDNKIKDVKLVSKVSKTNSSFSTFEQDVKTAPSSSSSISLSEQNNGVIGDIKDLKEHNSYVFGTSLINDPFGMSIVGENKGPDIKSLKPTINYSSTKLNKKDSSYVNLADNGNSSKFIYNINQKWELSSEHNFYYMTKDDETLELQITHSINNRDFTFYVQFGGLRKIYTPLIETYVPKNKNDDKKHSFVGWAFNSYRFSNDYSKGVNTPYRFRDISLKISDKKINETVANK